MYFIYIHKNNTFKYIYVRDGFFELRRRGSANAVKPREIHFTIGTVHYIGPTSAPSTLKEGFESETPNFVGLHTGNCSCAGS